MRDPYLYPNTEVLINKLNIMDFDQLQKNEKAICVYKSEIPLPDGNLDYDHLKAIHKHFFDDLYDWAGQERTVDISKGKCFFGNHQFIEKALQKIFSQLAQDNYLQNLPFEPFIQKLAHYFSEINAAHPFREGNGRTLRAFCGVLSKKAGYCLDWTQADRESYIEASIAGFEGSDKEMEKIFEKICLKNSIEIKTIHELSQETQELIGLYLEQDSVFRKAVNQKVVHIGENPGLYKEFAQLSRQAHQSMLSIASELTQKDDFKYLHDFFSQENKCNILDVRKIPLEEIREKFNDKTLSAQETMLLFKKIHNNAAELNQAKNQSLSLKEDQGYSY